VLPRLFSLNLDFFFFIKFNTIYTKHAAAHARARKNPQNARFLYTIIIFSIALSPTPSLSHPFYISAFLSVSMSFVESTLIRGLLDARHSDYVSPLSLAFAEPIGATINVALFYSHFSPVFFFFVWSGSRNYFNYLFFFFFLVYKSI